MIYFGENQEYILAECEVCKSEMYLEKESITEETAYICRLATPVKCVCGSIDEYINKAKKSCYSIRHELEKLSDLLHKRQDISEQINEINMEVNKKIKHPSFMQIFTDDIMFSLKIFFLIIAAALGIEIFLFVITCLLFLLGMVMNPGLAEAGNKIFYNINIFKDQGGKLLSIFGLPEKYPVLDSEEIAHSLILNYIPYALVGLLIVIFYVSLLILAIRLIVSVVRAGIYASKVVNQKYTINQKKDDYNDQLNSLMLKYQDLSDQINSQTILSNGYKNSRTIDRMLRYFLDNRVDTLREAVNLYHSEELQTRNLEYQKAIFNELRQTKRYAKALYILSSDDNVKVNVQEETYENDDATMGETLKNAFNSLRKTSTARIKAETPLKAIEESKTLENPGKDDEENRKFDIN